MKKEEFVYQYLLKYNEYENTFNGEKAVEFWKEFDKKNDASGLLFMVLRNAIVHNTLETISQIEKINSYSKIIESLKDCKVQSEDRKQYLSIIFDNKRVKADLKKKQFEIVNTTRQDIFKLFQKKEDELYLSIFFSHEGLLFDTSISTYNYKMDCREFHEGYYIESELLEGQYKIKFFKEDLITNKYFIYNINIYMNKNFNLKTFYQSIEFIEILIVCNDAESNTDIKINKLEIGKYKKGELCKLINTYIPYETVKNVAYKIKKKYQDMNSFLHIIGIQNDI